MTARTVTAILILASLATAIGAIALRSLTPGPDDPTVTSPFALWVALLAYCAAGALIVWRQPRNPIGWLLYLTGLGWELFLLGSVYGRYQHVVVAAAPDTIAPIVVLTANLWCTALLFTLVGVLFPDGRAPGAIWRLSTWATAGYVGIFIAVGIFQPGPIPAAPYLLNPWGVDAIGPLAMSMREGALSGLFAGPLVLSVIAIIARYRTAGLLVRSQIRWVAYAVTLLVVTTLVMQIIVMSPLQVVDPQARTAASAFGGIPFALAFAAVPISIGVALFRYRLYDIDILINRTLVYGAVSAALLATYLGAVLLFQAALRPFTSGNELAVAGSTLLVVALFQPVRHRVQDAVDRRFYRSRYDAARTLDAFSARLRNEVELEAVRADLIGAVRDTVRPAHASVWLRERS